MTSMLASTAVAGRHSVGRLSCPPRLLYVSTISASLEGFLGPFARHFRSLGWRVDGLARGATSSEQCSSAFDTVHEAVWTRNPLDPRNLLANAGPIRQAVSSAGYNIVHVHTPVAAFVTRFALRSRTRVARPAVIYTAHGFHFHPHGNALKNLLFRTAERIAGRWTDHLVVINGTDERAARESRIVDSTRIHHIPGVGIDTDAFAPSRVSAEDVRRVRAELRADDGDSIILMLAEFNPGKRHADAVRAFAAAGIPRLHLALAGYGPTVGTVRALARKLGVEERIHFLGMRYDVPALIGASAAVLLPSEREGLSRSVMEALSLETPVLGTDIRGIRELVGGDAGILVRVGDILGLARAMRFVVENPAIAREMGCRARKRMMDFDLRRILAAHEELYNQVLEEQWATQL